MLKEMIEQAEADSDQIEKLEFKVDVAAFVAEIGDLAAEAITLAGISGPWQAAGIAVGTAGVLAEYVGVWLQMGGAYAEAGAEIARDHLKRGFSYVAALGGN